MQLQCLEREGQPLKTSKSAFLIGTYGLFLFFSFSSCQLISLHASGEVTVVKLDTPNDRPEGMFMTRKISALQYGGLNTMNRDAFFISNRNAMSVEG